MQTARRQGMVLLGAVVLLATFAGMLIGRMLSSVQ